MGAVRLIDERRAQERPQHLTVSIFIRYLDYCIRKHSIRSLPKSGRCRSPAILLVRRLPFYLEA